MSGFPNKGMVPSNNKIPLDSEHAKKAHLRKRSGAPDESLSIALSMKGERLPAVDQQENSCQQGTDTHDDAHAIEAQPEQRLQPYKDQIDRQ
jgi:hypothetical protein